MNDRLWIFQVEFYDSTRRLERFISERRISAIKFAESVVEHTDCDGRCGSTDDSWPSIHLGGRGKIRPRYSAWYQYLRRQTTKQLETSPQQETIEAQRPSMPALRDFTLVSDRTEDFIASKPRPEWTRMQVPASSTVSQLLC